MRTLIRFRPSSHSDNCTIIARYKTEKEAEWELGKLRRFLKKLRAHKQHASWGTPLDTDWHPSQAGVKLEKKKLKFQVYTDDFVKQVLKVFERSKPKKITVLHEHLEIRITLMTPTKTTLNFLPLMLTLSEAKIVQKLNHLCGLPRCVTRMGKQYFYWYFNGEEERIGDVKSKIEDMIENEGKQSSTAIVSDNPVWNVCYW